MLEIFSLAPLAPRSSSSSLTAANSLLRSVPFVELPSIYQRRNERFVKGTLLSTSVTFFILILQ